MYSRSRRTVGVAILTFLVLLVALLLLQPARAHEHKGLVAVAEQSEDANRTVMERAAPREVPTREEDGWRRLREDESVPQGSHVRLNMTSGEKWVKVDPTTGERILELLSGLPDDTLMERIESIRKLGQAGSDEFENAVKELWDERQAQLSSSYNETTGAEKAEAKVTTLCKHLSYPDLVSVDLLEELDELVEDVEEAQTFANANHQGLEKCLNIIEHEPASSEVKSLAASIIGKSVKSMTDLQNATIVIGGFGRLFDAFKKGVISETKAVFSLGSLLRGSRDAALEALKHPEFFHSLVERLGRSTSHKIRERVAALVGDLLMEPDEWCWSMFRQAGLCHSSVDFTPSEVSSNQHFGYADSLRNQVCAKQEL